LNPCILKSSLTLFSLAERLPILVEFPLAHFQLRFSKPALYRAGRTEVCVLIPRGGSWASTENRIKTRTC
jgi:hypothetical protein